ncbi:hypothetical protein DFH08DRAFT_1012222 [Mycena albidolilacea]|uniref:Uncharacterized protein n=1 Tax=Mycena albidolilacea TaxID=1033008 RepID=A0AAD7EPX5_9AGAR|nr:hypothetical protein DFH08DRAFT_1012222 [Mycena albidolilacea]
MLAVLFSPVCAPLTRTRTHFLSGAARTSKCTLILPAAARTCPSSGVPSTPSTSKRAARRPQQDILVLLALRQLIIHRISCSSTPSTASSSFSLSHATAPFTLQTATAPLHGRGSTQRMGVW